MSDVLAIKNLSFSYGTSVVLDHLTMTIPKREFVALIGENGVGKSTLLNLIMRTFDDYKGQIELFGDDIKHNAHFNDIAYISQNAMIAYKDFPTTVEEVLTLHARYLKNKTPIENFLEIVGLTTRAHHALNELSGGQLQRVALAIALIKDGDFIILDEPTSGIDKDFSAAFYGVLKTLVAKGKTILMTTHHMSIAAEYVDRVLCIKDKQCIDITDKLDGYN